MAKRKNVVITLPPELVDMLDRRCLNKSHFIESLIREWMAKEKS